MSRFTVLLPPLSEQHRIVAKIEELFTRLDAGVEALTKIKTQLKRYRQAILKHAFEGKLTAEWRQAHKDELEPASALLERIRQERPRTAGGKNKEIPPPDTFNMPELPEGWAWTRLGGVVDRISNGITQRQEKTGGDIPVTRIETIADGTINLNRLGYLKDVSLETVEKYRLLRGDVLFSHINSDLHLGKTAVLHLDSHSILHGMNLLLIRANRSFLSPEFLDYLCRHYRLSGAFISIAQHAVNQSSINQAKLNNLVIPLPPLSEQRKIVGEIERRFSVADQIEKTVDQGLKQAERLRQSILKRAFEGKLVPQDPDDEPAEIPLERIREERASLQAGAKSKKTTRKRTTTQEMRLM